MDGSMPIPFFFAIDANPMMSCVQRFLVSPIGSYGRLLKLSFYFRWSYHGANYNP